MHNPSRDPQTYNQEIIYDERYLGDYDGMGGVITHLTAEDMAMTGMVNRLRQSRPGISEITILDHGYGLGRVPNEFVCRWNGVEDLTVVAYDVSRVGLERAMKTMSLHLPTVTIFDDTDRRVGECTVARDDPGPKRTIRFVHGRPEYSPLEVAEIAHEENGGQFDISTSWYDAIGHEPVPERRVQWFQMLGKLTHDLGELAVTVSTIGDLAAGDEEVTELALPASIGESKSRDVVYETEIVGLANYLHLFEQDFEECMRAARSLTKQYVWLQPIRTISPAYKTSLEEQTAYGQLTKWDREHRRNPWKTEDYASIQIVGGFRSAVTPPFDRYVVPQ